MYVRRDVTGCTLVQGWLGVQGMGGMGFRGVFRDAFSRCKLRLHGCWPQFRGRLHRPLHENRLPVGVSRLVFGRGVTVWLGRAGNRVWVRLLRRSVLEGSKHCVLLASKGLSVASWRLNRNMGALIVRIGFWGQ